MKNVLVIDSSLNGAEGNSSKLSRYFADTLAREVGADVNTRDTTQGLGHLTPEEMQAWMTDSAERSPQQRELAAPSEDIIAEVQRADVLVVGMPLYNFGVPSSFKSWVDRLARAGITFRYTENGPQGLLTDKKVYVLAARGGRYAGTPLDTQTGYLRDVFAFLGLKDVEFVYAEGLAMGDEAYEAAMSAARAEIDALIDAEFGAELASVA